jgi:hypothetical protein
MRWQADSSTSLQAGLRGRPQMNDGLGIIVNVSVRLVDVGLSGDSPRAEEQLNAT